LTAAEKKAQALNSHIQKVNANSALGGGGGGSRNRSKGSGGKALPRARGGVVTEQDAQRYGTLPGYAPGVDSIPAILSPGEAVLRPEVAQALGRETIDAWNQAAIQGKIKYYARGTA